MRIALLSDIHGNEVALRAVLEDIEAQGGVDAYWVLGDLVALGPKPVEVLEQIISLTNLQVIRGNTDRYVTTGARPYPTHDDVSANLNLLPRLVQVAETFAWTQGVVTHGGWFDWLSALPVELRTVLPNGTRLLGVHAAPGNDDGDGIREDHSDAEVRSLLSNCEADLVVVGHTHRPLERYVDGIHAVNIGSVSIHVTSNKYASYAILASDYEGYSLTQRQVHYDRAAVISQLEQVHHPGRAFIVQFLED